MLLEILGQPTYVDVSDKEADNAEIMLERKIADNWERNEYKNVNPVMRTISNIPKSGSRYLSDVINALSHPADTVENIGKVAAGVGQKVGNALGFETGTEYIPYADAVGSYYKDRYYDNLGETIQRDPVGVLADVTVPFSAPRAFGARLPGMMRSIAQFSPIRTATKIPSAIGHGVRGAENVIDNAVIAGANATGLGKFVKTTPKEKISKNRPTDIYSQDANNVNYIGTEVEYVPTPGVGKKIVDMVPKVNMIKKGSQVLDRLLNNPVSSQVVPGVSDFARLAQEMEMRRLQNKLYEEQQ